MRAATSICVVIVCLLGSPTLLAGESSVAKGLADRMTREAIAAGAAGDIELREELLVKAVRVAPDHGPARWARGELQADGDWKPIAKVLDAARQDEQLQRYESIKSEMAGTAANHLELARWCRSNDLDDEARYHWLNVLAVNADNREALRALDSVWVDGELVPRDEAATERVSPYKLRQVNRQWRGRIAGWERALAVGGDEAAQALVELDAEVDESAIPEFEKLAAGRRGTTAADNQRHLELCIAFVRALGTLPSYEASESLVRFAVLADDEMLRTDAAEQLIGRPEHEYIPLLVEGLAAVLESSFEIRVSPTGRVSYDHEVFAEGPNGDQQAEVARTGGAVVTFDGEQTSASVRQGLARGRAISARHLRQFWAEAAFREQQVSATNAEREALNKRIVDVLEQVTGETFGNNPQAWWDYWYDHNGYESRTGRPLETYRTSTSQLMEVYIEPQLRPDPPLEVSGTISRRSECFAAGTLVWTKTGLEPIETLTEGDLVLTINVETGERCFRPVLATTRRPPSKLMHLATNSYQLMATPGHPFWVEGAGWKMAKELNVGDYITTAEGTPLAVRVLATSDIEQEAFNLVVEGNNNYFVGVEGLLSHDNTPRRPELARAGTW